MNKRGFTEEEAAYYIGMSRAFLRQDRMNGIRKNRTPGPNYIKAGRSIRYLKEDLDGWLEKHRIIEQGWISEE
jgi:hypothetical protein